jgi:hypothetical protein
LTNIDVSKPLDNAAYEQWEANPSTEWFIYDSLNCHTIENANAAKIVLQKIHPDESAVNVNFVHEKQNENDYGLYAIAYASSLLNAQEPGIRVYDQSELRSQYNDFIDRNCTYLFAFCRSIELPGYTRRTTSCTISF